MKSSVSHSQSFWPAYADLALSMVMILVLFLLSFTIVSTMTAARIDFRSQDIESRKVKVRDGLAVFVGAGIRRIEDQGQRQLLILDSSVLFQPDRAHRRDMTPQGIILCKSIGDILRQNLSALDRIEVEGHADVNPSRVFYRPEWGDLREDHGNWMLSAARAKTVVEIFQEQGIPGRKLAVIGRSKYVPVRSEANKEENRRIEIAIWYSLPALLRPEDRPP